MPIYYVDVREEHAATYAIEAESPEEAVRKIEEDEDLFDIISVEMVQRIDGTLGNARLAEEVTP